MTAWAEGGGTLKPCLARLFPCLLLWFVGLFSSAPVAKAVEYELSGSFERFGRRQSQEEQTRIRDFVTERTPPGEKPVMTKKTLADYERKYGVSPFQMRGDPQPLGEKFNREFKVWVRDNAWCIHTRAPGTDPKSGWEHGMEDGNELMITLVLEGGGAMGMVGYRFNPVPHSGWDFGVPIVWMMTASGGHFDTLTNSLVWPAHMTFGGGKPGEPEPDRRQPCVIERREGKPGLPMMLAFRTADGRTNAFYRAIGFREFGRLSLPSGFVFESYGGLDYSGGVVSLRVNDRIVAHITNFVATCARKDLRPRVLPGMTIADYRVTQPTNQLVNAGTNAAPSRALQGYAIQDAKWPSVAKAQDMVDGRKRTAKTWIVAAVGAVVLLGGAVWWWRRRWRRPFMPVRPPTDVPGA